MYRLAKCGFSQSYTYFAWRNAAWEIVQYCRCVRTGAQAATLGRAAAVAKMSAGIGGSRLSRELVSSFES
jgi:hypothetical protein